MATGVGPVVVGLHVVFVQLLPTAAVAGVQLATNVGPVLFQSQVRPTQLLPTLPLVGVQLATGVGPVLMVVQPIPAPLPFGPEELQDATPTAVPFTVRHSRRTQLLPALPESGVQAEAFAQFRVCTSLQVVAVKLLPAFRAASGVQLGTPVGPVLLAPQVVLM